MKIRCHTNLDLYPYEKWTEELPCRPMVGDIIISSTGLELRVCRVVFKEATVGTAWRSDDGVHEYAKPETMCYVELHLPEYRFENISAFEEWYRNRRI